MNEEEGVKTGRRPALKVTVFAVVLLLLVVAAVAIIMLTSRKDNSKTATLPASVLNKVTGFTAYAYAGSPPLGYKIDRETVNYDEGVLFVTLQAPEGGQKFALTEQAMPEEFANTEDLIGDETIKGADGKAVISHREGRAIATMVSRDKKTLIILTGDGGSSTTIIGDLIRALKPIR